LMTQSGSDTPAQFVGRIARLSRNVGQPNRVLAESIADHEAERRPGAREERLAMTKHMGAEVESILIDKTKVGQASRQVWSTNANLPNQLWRWVRPTSTCATQPHFGLLRHEVVFLRVIIRTVFVPITHYLVHASTVHNGRQVAHMLLK
jgi:hypothetical protein